MKFILCRALAWLGLGTLFASAPDAPARPAAPADNSPYGVCAHLASGDEHARMPDNLHLMRDAGIAWARADFPWSHVTTRDGRWRFNYLDRVVDAAEQQGLRVLPILDYSVPWADPAHAHLDAWAEYVDKVVSRYKNRLAHWEVWNEQNLDGFWKNPDPRDYQRLLERTHATIKQIDPALQVVYGGLAGIPKEYITQSLELGAAGYFDVFNVHPYRPGMRTLRHFQQFYDELRWVRETLDKNGAAGKPIWITEQGWATPPGRTQVHAQIIAAAQKILAPHNDPWTVAVLLDERYVAPANWGKHVAEKMLPPGFRARFVTLDELARLAPAEYPALLLPPGEFSPTPYLDALRDYVKNGGTLFLFGGVPFYYDTVFQNGFLENTAHGSEAARASFRLGWQAWWTEKGVPETAPVSVVRDAAHFFQNAPLTGAAGRFLTAKNLRAGDRFIPLLEAKRDTFTGAVAGIYRYGDWRGAVAVCTLMGEGVNATEEEQAVFLPQAMLLAFQAGVARYFWYEFHAPEGDDLDKEHHFGIVHRDLSPKPAYRAYQTLTRARPAGSVPLTQGNDWNKDDTHCAIRWRRPDGKTGAAYWSPVQNVTVPVPPNAEMFDHLGRPVNVTDGRLSLTPATIYVIEDAP